MRKLFLLFSLIFIFAGANAQVKVSGIIKDATGKFI